MDELGSLPFHGEKRQGGYRAARSLVLSCCYLERETYARSRRCRSWPQSRRAVGRRRAGYSQPKIG